jgi:hypothetical protein
MKPKTHHETQHAGAVKKKKKKNEQNEQNKQDTVPVALVRTCRIPWTLMESWLDGVLSHLILKEVCELTGIISRPEVETLTAWGLITWIFHGLPEKTKQNARDTNMKMII